ncbi:MAG: ribosomal-protein-alanine N-acetyltransferase [Oceanicoccus sp.]
MGYAMMLKNMLFSTDRLNILPLHEYYRKSYVESDFLLNVVAILSPSVVASLPPYFQGIEDVKQAQVWLDKMQNESDCYVVAESGVNVIVGFLFLYEADDNTAHLGYLLAEKSWGKGFASELLIALVQQLKKHNLLKALVGGVDANNAASIQVLRKAGFHAEAKHENNVLLFRHEF